MKKFKHINATTIEEAVSILASGKAQVIAGGTDLLGVLKDNLLPDYPETVVNIKTIPGMSFIAEVGGMLRIGALTLLDDIALSQTIRQSYTVLAEAAGRVAHPHIREMGTIGGNICQLPRCWYFRVRDNRFFCRRKGGEACPALTGDARYHSIFGRLGGCVAVNPSDIAPALIVLDAKIKTTKRVIDAENFFSVEGSRTTILDTDEIVREISLPLPDPLSKSAFIKYALRKSIDFPLVNCAALIGPTTARICLNAVFNKPYRAFAAEEVITGKLIEDTELHSKVHRGGDEEPTQTYAAVHQGEQRGTNKDGSKKAAWYEAIADAAGTAAVSGAKALPSNAYKVQIARVLVKRAILACL